MEIIGQIFLGIIAFLIILKILWYLFSLILTPFSLEDIRGNINSLNWDIATLKSELENLKNDNHNMKEKINNLENELYEIKNR